MQLQRCLKSQECGYRTELHSIAGECSALCWIALNCDLLQFTALYCSALYNAPLYGTSLTCTLLHHAAPDNTGLNQAALLGSHIVQRLTKQTGVCCAIHQSMDSWYCTTVKYSAMQWNSVKCSDSKCSTVHCNAVQCLSVWVCIHSM